MADRIPVVCRPARPEDKPAVLEMTSRIWEGDDYIQYVWDEWLAHTEGQLAVAEADGRIVGMAKLTKMGQGEWVLQGLRTHPDLEGRGIASQMHHYIVELWEQTGDGTLRMLTTSKRLPVHHLAEGTGFNRAANVTTFKAPGLVNEEHAFRLVQAIEVDAALQFVKSSPLYPLQFRLMNIDWSFVPPTAENLLEAVQAGNACWWQPGGKGGPKQGVVLGFEEIDVSREVPEAERTYVVQMLACDLEALGSLLVDFRRLAAARGCRLAMWMAGFFPVIQPHLQASGFVRTWDASGYVYAKPHPTRSNLS